MGNIRVLELSDDALEGVAGGLSTMSVNTYSPIGPATTGPSAGPAGGISCAAGETRKDKLFDSLVVVDKGVLGLLDAAGTLEKYNDDLFEYSMKYSDWKRAYDLDPIHMAPPPPPPNPYDYL